MDRADEELGLAPVQAAGLVRLLGQPRLQSADGLVHLLEAQDAALLLMVLGQGPLTRQQACGWLWPGADPSRALNSLRQRLFRLKQAMGQPVLQGRTVLTLAPGWQHDLWPDLSGWTAGQPMPPLLGHLQWHAEAELAERVALARTQWSQRWQQAHVARAEQCERDGQLAQALAHAAAVLAGDQGSEHAHRRLMRLHYLQGDAAAALAAFEHCRRALRREVHAEPGAQTLALVELLRSGQAWPPGGALATPQAAEPSLALRRPPRLVGRSAEWQRMAEAWRSGRVVLVSGEAGMGKSRLAEDFARACGPAQLHKAHGSDPGLAHSLLVRVLRSVMPLLPTAPPWALAELAHLMPELGPPSQGPVAELRLRQAVTEALRGWPEQGLGALVLDDLQWADPASLDSLLAWHDGLPGGAVPLLLVARSGELPPSLRRWLDSRGSAGALACELRGLDPAALAELLRSLDLDEPPEQDGLGATAAAGRLWQRTGGHPFLVLELLRADAARVDAAAPLTPGEAAAPEHLLQLIGRRLAQLPAPALRLLRLAALADGQFSVALASQVLGQQVLDLSDDLACLQQRQLLGPQAELFDLVREAVLQSLPEPVAAQMHQQLARALQQRQAPANVLALHYGAAGCWPQAAAQHEAAALQARCLSRRAEELAHWMDAARAHEQPADARNAGLDADASAGAGRVAAAAWQARLQAVWPAMVVEAMPDLRARLDALLATAGTPAQQLQALLLQARVLLNANDAVAARAPAERALALAHALGTVDQLTVATGWLALAEAMAQELDPALQRLAEREPFASASRDERTRLDLFGAYGYVLHLAGRYQDALVYLERAAAAAIALGDLAEALEQTVNLSLCATSLGQRSAAIQAGEQALDYWRRLGQPDGGAVASLHLQMGTLLVGQGRFEQGLALTEWAVKHFRRSQATGWRVIAEHRWANAWLRLGQTARAHQALSDLAADANAGNQAARCMVQARLAHAAGRSPLGLLNQAWSTWGSRLEPMDARALQLMLAAHLPADDALPLCDALLAQTDGRDTTAAMHALARRADAHRRLGQAAQAGADAAAAWAMADHSRPLDLDWVSFAWLVAQAAAAAGDTVTAAAALGSAGQWLAGARPHLPAVARVSFEQLPVHQAVSAALRRQDLAAG